MTKSAKQTTKFLQRPTTKGDEMKQISDEVLTQVREALAMNRVMARDAEGNYTRDVTPKKITAAIAAIETAQSEPVITDEKGRPMTYWGGKAQPEPIKDHEKPSMWENTDKTRQDSAHYSILRKTSGCDGMDALREFFPEATADEMNLVLFSTSGVHGTYNTIEDAEADVIAPSDGTFSEVTFLIVQPRMVALRYGVCNPETKDDIDFLKRLRKSSHAALLQVGAAQGQSHDHLHPNPEQHVQIVDAAESNAEYTEAGLKQAVRDAYEEAARICDEHGDIQSGIADAIRALIKKVK